METVLKAEKVSIRYITGDFKDIGLKEYVARRVTGNYQINEFMAVDGVSFELQQGDMLGIIGTNGAGKSTLLKAIAGIMEPTSGRIESKGEIAALLELGSGFDGDLTVKENAYLRGAMLGYTREFMDKTYDQIIDFAELRDFENRPFKQLSSGMKSRLAFSIASLVKPDILILDEVLSVGDGAFQEKSAKKMREIIAQGATTILVSHSLEQIRQLCNKVLWLDHGRQVAFGGSTEICDEYEEFLRGERPARAPNHQAGSNSNLDNILIASEKATINTKAEFVVRRKKHIFSRGLKFLKSCGILCHMFCLCIILLSYFISYGFLENKSQVEVSICLDTRDNVSSDRNALSLRGAFIDDVWINPETIYKSGNWTFDNEQHVYTNKDNEPCVILLPCAKKINLVFNSGPKQGIAKVKKGDFEYYFDCYNDSFVELGRSFNLPIEKIGFTKIKTFLCCISLLFSIITSCAFLYIYNQFRRNKERINWNNIEKAYLIVLFPIVFCVLYFLSVSSSPYVSESAYYWGEDGSFYTLLGKTCAEGAIPYIDIWEQKGPIIFLIYTIGYIFSPNYGVFMLQNCFLYISFVLSYFIGKELGGIGRGIVASLMTVLFYILVMDEGALIEDFNLPFLMLSTYLALKYLSKNDNVVNHPPQYSVVHGITCGVSLGLRITNCIGICGVIIYIFFMLLLNKEYKNIIKNIFAFLFGLLLVVFPFVVYFTIHNALYDLVWGSLLYNIQYTNAALHSKHTIKEWIKIIIYLTPIIVCCVLAWEQKKNIAVPVTISAVLSALMLSNLFLFQHYFIIVLPFVPISISWALQDNDWSVTEMGRYKISYIFCVVATVLVLTIQISYAANNRYAWMRSLHNIKNESDYVLAIKDQVNLIPSYDRNFVIGYNVRPDWYLISDIRPCYKYYTNQDWAISMSRQMEQENIKFYESSVAKWIVVQGNIAQQEIAQIITSNYRLYDSHYVAERETYLNLYMKK